MSLRQKLISVDLGLAVEGNARTENTKFSRTLLHFSVCLGSLNSPRASRRCLNGHPSAPKVASCDVTTRSFPIFFKKERPGTNTKRDLAKHTH